MKKNFEGKIATLFLAAFVCSSFATAQYTFAESASQDIPEGIYNYLEKDGKQTIPFIWQAEESSGGIAITVQEHGKTFYNLCTADGETLMWHMQIDGKHDLSAVRKDDTLHIEGIRFGEKYSKTVTIDERPWYQPLSFSLGNFLNSSATKTSFWIIRADKIEVIALTAEKIGVEDVVFDGADIPAQKIEVRADGFYAKFWHATYWYRESDNLFLRYQSTHGLPGAAETIVELVETPAQRGADS
jgi:hypothetical protein